MRRAFRATLGSLVLAAAPLAGVLAEETSDAGPQLEPPRVSQSSGGRPRMKSHRPSARAGANQPTNLEIQQELHSVLSRLEESEKQIQELKAELTSRPAVIEQTSAEGIDATVDATIASYQGGGSGAAKPAAPKPKYEAGYDRGFFIRPANKDEGIPFDLLIKGWTQFRHTGFESDVADILDRNDFEVERGRLIFSGHFIDPKLAFMFNIDADDDDNFDLKFHDVYMTYEFTESFMVSWGKWKVPGSRDWLEGARMLRFTDRSMATNFFRPDRTTGVWFHGKPTENTFYTFMIGNGLFTTDLTPSQIDDQFALAASMYWDPFGDYGQGYSDLEMHESPVVRLGHSLSWADHEPTSTPGEQRAFRLVDSGSLLVTTFPAATTGFDVILYAMDAGVKYCGFSANAEWFFRWIDDLEADPGPTDLYDYGFVAEVGYFVVPKKVEAIARMSRVSNDGGSPSADEYATGFNYFINGHNLKFTFDVSVLNGSPAQNAAINIRAGDDGVLFRNQLVAGF